MRVINNIMGNEYCGQCKQTSMETFAYGSHQVLQESSAVLAVVEKKVEKDPRLQKTVAIQLQMRRKINHPHIVKLHKYNIEQETYGFKVTMFYQYIPKTLRERAEELRNMEKEFSERELFAIIYGIQSALFKFNTLEIRHSCVNLDTILCKNNFYKLTDVSSTTYVSSFDLTTKGNRQQFLSENLLQMIRHQSLNPKFQLSDDIFSLGMICLSLGSGMSVNQLYIWNEKGEGFLNIKNIDLAIKNLSRKYSNRLIKKIKALVFNPENQQKNQEGTITTDSMQELDEHLHRVTFNLKKMNSTTLSHRSEEDSQDQQ